MQYGLPYKGSKSKIARQLIDILPGGKTLYDLFAGGCAITHAAILSGKWDKVVANDIGPWPGLFKDAALGKYRNDTRWVSREDFFKSSDPFEKLLFSFGNDCRTYIYAAGEVENQKCALHRAICFADYGPMKELGVDLSAIDSCRSLEQRRLKAYRILAQVKAEAGDGCGWIAGNRPKLENLERLERLQNLDALERLQNLDALEVTQGDYQDVPIDPDGAVIYCDIPYANTNGYGKKKMSDFDYERFYDWACSQKAPVFISEYEMPEDRFEPVRGIKKIAVMAAKAPVQAVEKLYVPKGGGVLRDFSFLILINEL